jgi:integrase
LADLTCFTFTKKELEGLGAPAAGQRDYYRDDRVRGLQLTVYSSGRKVFILYRKVSGRPERILIGPFPDLSIEQARGKAQALNGQIANGGNPADQRRKLNAESTLLEAFTDFLENYKKPKRKSWHEDENQVRRYLDWETSARWKLRKLSDIRRADIEQLHNRVGEDNGPYAANRLLALLRAVFNRAAKNGWEGRNPAAGITKFPETERERFLEADEMPRFFRALKHKDTPAIFRDYFTLLLLTGARRANLLAMAWDELNLEAAVWKIPDTKSGKPVAIALVPEAVEILRRRKRELTSAGSEKTNIRVLQTHSRWVFPTNGKGRKARSGHLEEPKGAWKKLLERAGLKDVHLHDLRRTLGSWQAAGGTSLPVIGKSLGHLNQSTTAIYARMNLVPVRASVNAATQAMFAAGKKKTRTPGAERA